MEFLMTYKVFEMSVENVHYEFGRISIPIGDVDPGSPAVIILATWSEIRGFKPDRVRWIFQNVKAEYDFLRKGSKAVGPVS